MKKHSRKAETREDMSGLIKETIDVFHRSQCRLGHDMFSAGVTEIHVTRLLGALEQELQAVTKKSSKKTPGEIGREVACIISAHLLGELLGNLCKFLIRYHLQGILRTCSLLYTSLKSALSQGWCPGCTTLGAIVV